MASKKNPTKARSSDEKGKSHIPGNNSFKEPHTNGVSGEIDADDGCRSSLNMNRREARDPIRPNKKQILDKKKWRENSNLHLNRLNKEDSHQNGHHQDNLQQNRITPANASKRHATIHPLDPKVVGGGVIDLLVKTPASKISSIRVSMKPHRTLTVGLQLERNGGANIGLAMGGTKKELMELSSGMIMRKSFR